MDAKTVDARTHEFDVQDVEYLRHGDKPLLAKVYKPRGEGPFPALVDLHGGAWCLADRNTDKVRHEVLAGHGVIVVSLDWRTAKEGAYPLALADINYAIRWVKLHAKESEDPARSRRHLRPVERRPSGDAGRHAAARSALHGHSAAGRLARARRHGESRRDVVAGDQSARPLPLAKRQGALPNPPAWPPGIIDKHQQFWGGEENMTEGNPMLILERGEKVALPPAIWHQGRGDVLHDYKDEDFKAPTPRRRALSPTTKRPAATSSCTTSTATASPATRRT